MQSNKIASIIQRKYDLKRRLRILCIMFGNQNGQRFEFAADCYENQPPKQNNVFERENALKRNVATRPLARLVGWLLTFAASELPVKITCDNQQITHKKAKLTNTRTAGNNKNALPNFTTFLS